MRTSRLFTETPMAPGQEVALDDSRGHYAMRVLKLRPGDPVVLFNGDGFDYAGELLPVEGRQVRVSITARLPAMAESPLQIILAQGISRGERMDQTLQKATELGVFAIQPLVTERVEVRLQGERLGKRLAHWRGVLNSACEQCGRARVPALYDTVDLDSWLSGGRQAVRVALDPAASRPLSSIPAPTGPVALLVGPEGGLSEAELKRCAVAGFMTCCLGPRILRTETAGPAALAVLQAAFGDL